MSEYSQHSRLQFIKLGGSLITDKTSPQTARLEVILRLAGEIAAARQASPGLQLVLGHGSGSFGHVAGQKWGTRQGVKEAAGWLGFVEVWQAASALNRLVMDALAEAGVPALAFSPLSSVVAEDGKAAAWNLEPLQAALAAGLLPVVWGDVVFDRARGGTILSTEDLFDYLAAHLHPARLLLAGLEAGVWVDFPARTQLLEEITPENLAQVEPVLGRSHGTDVTGGMVGKVHQSLDLIARVPGLQVVIFSGEQPDALRLALLGQPVGTRLRALHD